MDISQLLNQMDQAVLKHRTGDLLLGWRIRLWSLMKRELGKEADFRRNVLAFLVAQDAYPRWENGELVSAIPPEDLEAYYAYPGRAMDEYVRFLKGRSSRKKLRAASDPLDESLDYWEGRPHDQMQLAYIIIQKAADRLLGLDDLIYEDRGWFDAVWDNAQHLQITDDSLGEREECEAHFFAAMAVTHHAKQKVAARRDFWRRWLGETVPSVLAPLPEVKALLKSWKGSGAHPPDETSTPQEIPEANAKEALRQHLQALALAAGEQQKLYAEGVCQICGLTMTVRYWSEHGSMASLIKKQNARRRQKLSRIQQLGDNVSQDSEVGCNDYEFTRKDARWNEIRNLARELLDDYSWPRRRHAKQESYLYGMPKY